MSDSLRSHGVYSPWNFPGQNTKVISQVPSPGDFPNLGIKPKSPALQADSLPAEPPGKPKNTGVGSLSLLQGIFPTKESNQGHLRCGRICYQLSHQGRPLALLSLRKLHGFEELYAKNQGQRTMCILSHR